MIGHDITGMCKSESLVRPYTLKELWNVLESNAYDLSHPHMACKRTTSRVHISDNSGFTQSLTQFSSSVEPTHRSQVALNSHDTAYISSVMFATSTVLKNCPLFPRTAMPTAPKDTMFSTEHPSESTPHMKRGRKRNDNLPPNRNRDVQRAFRARRAAHLEVRYSITRR